MWAVIFETAQQLGAGLRDIAGRPLLIRQLQWLRDNRIAPIVIEVCDGPHAAALVPLLLGTDPLLDTCIVVPTGAPLGPREVARRAGAPHDEPLVMVSSELLIGGALPSPCLEGRYRLEPPEGIARQPCELPIERPGTPGVQGRLHLGWGLSIDSRATAHSVACAVLSGAAPGVLVHAAEIKPGVWLGRGARVAEEALLRPPVLVGPGSRVLASAVVGPGAILGRAALVERGARVSEASVADDTWIGEGTELQRVHVAGGRVESLDSGKLHHEPDRLVLDTQRTQNAPSLGARLLAASLLCVLGLPWLLAATVARLRGRGAVVQRQIGARLLLCGSLGSSLDCVPPLLDAVRGRRHLVGPAEPALLEELSLHTDLPPGAFDVTPGLAPSAQREIQLRMWRWYARHRGGGLAFQLWWRTQLRRWQP